MSKTKDSIEHEGIVNKIGDGHLLVNILQHAGCLSCAVKSACNPSESETKEIDIVYHGNDYQEGEKVNIYYERALGFKALWWGYIAPFVVLMVVLVSTQQVTHNEPLSGLLALGSLLPYYAFLYMLRDKLKKEFSFRIEKLRTQQVPYIA